MQLPAADMWRQQIQFGRLSLPANPDPSRILIRSSGHMPCLNNPAAPTHIKSHHLGYVVLHWSRHEHEGIFSLDTTPSSCATWCRPKFTSKCMWTVAYIYIEIYIKRHETEMRWDRLICPCEHQEDRARHRQAMIWWNTRARVGLSGDPPTWHVGA
jgi:hypothetical protein